jgi:hypothetical protein
MNGKGEFAFSKTKIGTNEGQVRKKLLTVIEVACLMNDYKQVE